MEAVNALIYFIFLACRLQFFSLINIALSTLVGHIAASITHIGCVNVFLFSTSYFAFLLSIVLLSRLFRRCMFSLTLACCSSWLKSFCHAVWRAAEVVAAMNSYFFHASSLFAFLFHQCRFGTLLRGSPAYVRAVTSRCAGLLSMRRAAGGQAVGVLSR